jgi:hypothetical protein
VGSGQRRSGQENRKGNQDDARQGEASVALSESHHGVGRGATLTS